MSEKEKVKLTPSVLLATGLGVGILTPIAPGTVGTLWGIPIYWAMLHFGLTIPLQIGVCVLLFIVGLPICSRAEKTMGKKDDGRICADEYLTFPICMLGLPFEPWLVVVAFLSNRFFDIWKPSPARELQSLGGGMGIMVDDVISALYSLAFNWLVFWGVSKYILN